MKRTWTAILILGFLLLVGCSQQADIQNSRVSIDPTTDITLPPAPTGEVLPGLTTSAVINTQAATSTVVLPTAEPSLDPIPTSPPGIILFIGDGMGVNHRLAATWKSVGQDGALVMDKLPVHGRAQTGTANGMVTDSAASATSIASGVVTNYLAVGVDANGEPVTTILELAQAYGWSVGLVSTNNLSDATPAAFAAHVRYRSDQVEIAQQIMAHSVDVLLGGGEDDFYSAAEPGCYPGRGRQPSGVNLVAGAIENGYTYVCSSDQMGVVNIAEAERMVGLFAANQLIQPFSPTLVEMTDAALEILSRDPDGFFLMVEAGQIDWAAHDNNAVQTIQLTLGLDAAVAQAQIFALDRPNTLVIVAADHETGGMLVNLDGSGSGAQDGPFSMPDGTTFWVDWTTGSHTPDAIPVTAQGPFSEMLDGEYPLTRLYEAMFTYMFYGGLEPLE